MQFGRVPGSWSVVSLGTTPVSSNTASRTAGNPPTVPTPRSPGGSPVSRSPGTKSSEMNLRFDPEKSSRVNDATQIKFAQTCQIEVDGKILIKPSTFLSKWKFRDPWTLENGVFLDLMEDATDPFYPNMAALGRYTHKDNNQGIISDVAIMGDAPQIGNEPIMFHARENPKGFKAVKFRLQTFAIASQGDDAKRGYGRWYEGALWQWNITAAEHLNGGRGQATIDVINVGSVTLDMLAAFDKFRRVTGL